MKIETNPFAPGAGTPPPELAGRAATIENIEQSVARLKHGKTSQSHILVGLRGVGKTVILAQLEDKFLNQNLHVIQMEAHDSKKFIEMLVPRLRRALHQLSLVETARHRVRQSWAILKSFISTFKIKFNDTEISLGIEPLPGVADSGDLEYDLPDLFEEIGTCAKAANRALVLMIDEIQYLHMREMSALIMSLHRCAQRSLPLILVAAGLPQVRALTGNSKSYAERLFRFVDIGALDEQSAHDALQLPAIAEGSQFQAEALSQIFQVTKGYPYFLQQWGYEAWNASEGPQISQEDVRAIQTRAYEALDESFFQVRLDRCTPAEQKYMRAMAELGAGPHRTGDISAQLGVKPQTNAPVRSALIRKCMIFSPAHGDTAFTVPLFDEYMRRTMPEKK